MSKAINDLLIGLSYSEFKTIFARHLLWSKENNRVAGKPAWHEAETSINVMAVRCNSETDFNFGEYNDYLILIVNRPNESFRVEIIPVTVDPNRNKDGIAHLRQGVWNSYIIRPHRWAKRFFKALNKTIDRWAICQDLNPVELLRTNGKGKAGNPVRGHFGINIHDGGGYSDSSLGCTVLQNDSDYLEDFLPYIFDLAKNKKVPVNHNNITYCLINHAQFEKYVSQSLEKVERAKAVNAVEGNTSGGAVSATREGAK